jgi:glucose-6-phosphate 1-dehydrogenase
MMFKDTPVESASPDTLVIRIQPDDGIQLTAMASAPPPENGP